MLSQVWLGYHHGAHAAVHASICAVVCWACLQTLVSVRSDVSEQSDSETLSFRPRQCFCGAWARVSLTWKWQFFGQRIKTQVWEMRIGRDVDFLPVLSWMLHTTTMEPMLSSMPLSVLWCAEFASKRLSHWGLTSAKSLTATLCRSGLGNVAVEHRQGHYC